MLHSCLQLNHENGARHMIEMTIACCTFLLDLPLSLWWESSLFLGLLWIATKLLKRKTVFNSSGESGCGDMLSCRNMNYPFMS